MERSDHDGGSGGSHEGPPRFEAAAISNHFDAELLRLTDEERLRNAVLERSRRRNLVEQLGADSSLASVLTVLVERGEAATLTTASGNRHSGLVEGLGADFVVLSSPNGSVTLVPLAMLVAVRTAEQTPPLAHDGAKVGRIHLADLLGDWAAERREVVVRTRDGSRFAGTLRWVGLDALALSCAEGPERASGDLYVALGSVTEVTG